MLLHQGQGLGHDLSGSIAQMDGHFLLFPLPVAPADIFSMVATRLQGDGRGRPSPVRRLQVKADQSATIVRITGKARNAIITGIEVLNFAPWSRWKSASLPDRLSSAVIRPWSSKLTRGNRLMSSASSCSPRS